MCLVVLSACAAPVETPSEEQASGYVMLAEPAREHGFLKVEGVCRPLDGRWAEQVSSEDWALLIENELESWRMLDVVPERILLVHGIDEPDEVLEVDPDRAVVDAVDPDAVRALAAATFAETSPLANEESLVTSWTLDAPNVWQNAMLELPEGIMAVHPVPAISEPLPRDAVETEPHRSGSRP